MNLRALLLVALLLGACSDDGDGIEVTNVWARPTAPFANTAAFYGEIHNRSEVVDSLTAASTPSCEIVEIHRTSISADNVSSMTTVGAGVQMDAGESLTLQPNGLHIMCLGLAEQLSEGDSIDLTFVFAESEAMTVAVPVAAER